MTISNQGRTSNTRIDGSTFIKDDASYSGYCFQSYCVSNVILPVKFQINKTISYGHGTGKYRVIDEKPWKLDYSRAALIGTAMGSMHKQCYSALVAGEFNYLTMKQFTPPSDITKFDITQGELELRNDILNSLNVSVNSKTPKVPLHRDFRLHNILFDGATLWLIDFDYAAIDIVSHEIVAMMLDMSYQDIICVEYFISNYIKHSYLNITDNIVDEHLYYLATDTFPYDRKDQLTSTNYNALCTERASRLNRLKVFRDTFKEIIQKSLG